MALYNARPTLIFKQKTILTLKKKIKYINQKTKKKIYKQTGILSHDTSDLRGNGILFLDFFY